MNNEITESADGYGNGQEQRPEGVSSIHPENDRQSLSRASDAVEKQQGTLDAALDEELAEGDLASVIQSIERSEYYEGEFPHPALYDMFDEPAKEMLRKTYEAKIDAVFTKRAATVDKLADGEVKAKLWAEVFSFVWQLIFAIGSLVVFCFTQNAWSLLGLSLPAGNLVGQFVINMRKGKEDREDSSSNE